MDDGHATPAQRQMVSGLRKGSVKAGRPPAALQDGHARL